MGQSIDSDDVLTWAFEKLLNTTPKFEATGDPGERRKQIDVWIGHSAQCAFIQTMIDELNLVLPGEMPARSEELTLDQMRESFFRGEPD